MHRSIALLLAAGALACRPMDDDRVPADGSDQDGGGDTVADDTADGTDDTGVDDTAETDDTGEPDDTADTGAAWGDCAALESPMPIATTDDFWAAWQAHVPDLEGIEEAVGVALDNVDAAAACPTFAEVGGDGGSAGWEMSGDCTTPDGVAFTGRMALSVGDSAAGVATRYAFERFSVQLPGDPAAFRFVADGVLSMEDRPADDVAGLPALRLVDADLRHAFEHDGTYDVHPGDWAHRTHVEHVGSAGYSVADGYVWLVRDPRGPRAGDFCVSAAVTLAEDTCGEEGDGVVTVNGTNEAILTLDGSASCDGCGRLALDGADMGMTCPATGP